MKIAMAQINTTVGALEANTARIISAVKEAADAGADLVLLPEMAIPGYASLDLLCLDKYISDNLEKLDKLVRVSPDIVAVIGFVDRQDGQRYNAAAVMRSGQLLGVRHKTLLPTYEVFDEDRYFTPAKEIVPLKVHVAGGEVSLGIEICEDMWDADSKVKPTKTLVQKGADIILNISASPYATGKYAEREALIRRHVAEMSRPMFYCNLVGGQDELVFDGGSLAFDAQGERIAAARQFEEALALTEIDLVSGAGAPVPSVALEEEAEMVSALVLGVRDYFRKAGFSDAIIGLSGGVDSSLTAAVVVEALGPEHVTGISMPSRFSSEHSKTDAALLAQNLGIVYKVIPIEPVVASFEASLAAAFDGAPEDVTEENLQARARGTVLMALSNKKGALVVSTGNKTELALGYATLYGDMVGGLAAISDVSKLHVYRLARYYNEMKGYDCIPTSVLEKEPSAELREGQVDPFDYEVVSPLVDELVERRRSGEELVAMGYDPELVADIAERLRAAEYKRRQAAPGIKLTRFAFGVARKMPIVNHYREG